jgi:hypothetical protein
MSNNLDFDGLLPLDAFKKEGGRMRLHGGGGKSAPAPAAETSGVYTPTYNTYDYKTGKFSMEKTAPTAADPVASPIIVASTYQDILGRPPTMPELSQYKDTSLKASDIKQELMKSPEYMNKLAQPFIPSAKYDSSGLASIAGAQPTQPTTGIAGINAALQQQLAQPKPSFQFGAPPSVQAPQAARPVPGLPNTTQTLNPVQAQLAALVQQQEVARKAQELGIGAIAATPGAPAALAPRNTESGNIHSAGTTQMADGGLSGLRPQYNLGGYSDGGRLLRGPGDGVSDSIPAQIGNRQPARLADGEFVIPARIVSEIGNGSTDAGARRLYAMMDRIQKARRKTTGKHKIAVNSKAEKYLPA